MPSDIMLSVAMLIAIILRINTVSFAILSVIILSVKMLRVVAPVNQVPLSKPFEPGPVLFNLLQL
jgi:hypothetical protein